MSFQERAAHIQCTSPCLGSRFTVTVAHPAGAKQLNLAVFEDVNLEPERFMELTETVSGAQWKPIVTVRERDRECTVIYAQQSKRDLRLLVAALDKEDATFVELRIEPQQLIRFIDESDRIRK